MFNLRLSIECAAIGISAPFTGAAKELGQNMKRGIETARQLRLIAADDGYEPARAAVTMKQLYERDQVFGLVSMRSGHPETED